MKKIVFSTILILLLTFVSCTKVKDAAKNIDLQPDIFPDYIGVTVPVNIAPLNFKVNGATEMRADFSCEGVMLGTVMGKEDIQIPEGKWHDWLVSAKDKNVEVTVSVWNNANPDGFRYAPFAFSVSADSIDACVVYRLIEPGYESWQDIGIYSRELGSFDENLIVSNNQNHGQCLNCHSFQNYNPHRMLYHVRGEGGGTVFSIDGETKKIDLRQSNLKLNGVYPMWHKDGRFVVFSTNQTRQSFYSRGKTPIEVYDLSSDIFLYDVKNNKALADERFIGTAHLETFPAFSPDGKSLYLCSADSVNFETEFNSLKYSILRVDFNAEDGTLGERIDTLYNANVEAHSGSFPRISPDGRYLIFTESEFGTFPIWHREADLKMIDLTDGSLVDTSILNSEETESYHSFSSNGRWIVFSSRRIDSRYTRLFFSHVSSEGTFTKPLLLPQEKPDENTFRLKSYNVPEFTF